MSRAELMDRLIRALGNALAEVDELAEAEIADLLLDELERDGLRIVKDDRG